VHKLNLNLSQWTWFSVFADAMDLVFLSFNNSQMEVPRGSIVFVCLNSEGFARRKVFHGFRNVVQHLARKVYPDGFHVWRHLEVNHCLCIIFNFEVVEVLRDWDVVDIVLSSNRSLHILELGKRCLSSINQKLRSNDNLCAVAYEDLLAVKEESAIKCVLLRSSHELTHLREGSMLHDDFVLDFALSVRYEDGSFFFVGLVEFLFEEDARLVVLRVASLADLLLVIQDVKQVAGYG